MKTYAIPLKIARVYVRLLFLIACLGLYHNLSNPYQLGELTRNPIWLATASLWIVFWFLCLRNLARPFARIGLGVSAFAFLIYCTVCSLAPAFNHHHTLADLANSLLLGLAIHLIPVVGFGAMLWVSVRPPSDATLLQEFASKVGQEKKSSTEFTTKATAWTCGRMG